MTGYRPATGGSSSGGPPTGPATGVLSGTYPGPGFAVDMATQAELDAAIAALGAVYQPLAATLTSLVNNGTPTSFGLAWLLLANAVAGRGALGLGSAATQASTAFDAAGAAAAAQAASQPLAAILTTLVANGAPGTEGLALLLASTPTAALTSLGTGTAALVNTGTGAGNVPTVAQADARYAPIDPPSTAITPTTGAVSLDFAALDGGVHTLGPLTGAVTFASANLAAKRNFSVIITNGATLRAMTFPGWIFLAGVPASIAASKTGVLTVHSPGTTDAAVVAAYNVQP